MTCARRDIRQAPPKSNHENDHPFTLSLLSRYTVSHKVLPERHSPQPVLPFMLQLINRSRFRPEFAILNNPDGEKTAFLFIRGLFGFDGQLRPGDFQENPKQEDEFWEDPVTSSLKIPSDITLEKPGTDVLLVGDARVPEGKEGPAMLVRLRVGALEKNIAVFGDRVWEKSRFGFLRISKPLPIDSCVPLRWERAYGGTDKIGDDDSTFQQDERNPLGVGFIHPKQKRSAIVGRPLPNLENPFALIQDWDVPAVPVGCGAISPRWKPRCDDAGTYDEAWKKGRAPVLPTDFDPRFFCVAPADQVIAGGLQGGEPVEVTGVTADGKPLLFTIPVCPPQVVFRFADTEHPIRPAKLETVFIQPDEGQFSCTWAIAQPCGKKVLDLKEILLLDPAPI
jgi:hypothetical protein